MTSDPAPMPREPESSASDRNSFAIVLFIYSFIFIQRIMADIVRVSGFCISKLFFSLVGSDHCKKAMSPLYDIKGDIEQLTII